MEPVPPEAERGVLQTDMPKAIRLLALLAPV
jgi:hypothetical protein